MVSSKESYSFTTIIMGERWPEHSDIQQAPSAPQKPVESGFNPLSIDGKITAMLRKYDIYILPYIDSKWRLWSRVMFPQWITWSYVIMKGDQIIDQGAMLKNIMELDGTTSSFTSNDLGVSPNGEHTIHMESIDKDGAKYLLDIRLPRSEAQSNNELWDQVSQNLAQVLAPNTWDWQSIMNNIDYIAANASRLKPEQVDLFRRALKYGIENNGNWLEVMGFDPKNLNNVYVKFWPNHFYSKSFQYELGNTLLQKNGPRYNELMKRTGELATMRPFPLTVTSENWKWLNAGNPDWNKPLPPR